MDNEGIMMMAGVIQAKNESGVVDGPNAVAKAVEALAEESLAWHGESANTDGETWRPISDRVFDEASRPIPDGFFGSESIGDSMMRAGGSGTVTKIEGFAADGTKTDLSEMFGIAPPSDPLRRHPDDQPKHDPGCAEPDPNEDLVRRTRWWASLLGVSDWRIAVTNGADDRQLGKSSIARVHRTNYYDEAVVMLRGGAPSDGLYSVAVMTPSGDEPIVHELLHLVFNDWDLTEDDALKLIPDEATRKVFIDRLVMRQEQSIERLAFAFVTLVESMGWRPDMQTPLSCGAVIADRGILENPTFHDGEQENPAPIDGPTDRAYADPGDAVPK